MQIILQRVQSTVDRSSGRRAESAVASPASRDPQTAADQPNAGERPAVPPQVNGDQLTIRPRINGEQRSLAVTPGTTLLTALREHASLTAAKEGCGQGDCGSCVVIMNGRPVNSCLVLAAEADGAEITTLEGLADGERLHPLQEEFCRRWSFQCGYCTPGMVMSCFALLAANPDPTEAEVREAVEGNLCRCTNYRPIIEATMAAASRLSSDHGPAAPTIDSASPPVACEGRG